MRRVFDFFHDVFKVAAEEGDSFSFVVGMSLAAFTIFLITLLKGLARLLT